MTLRAQILEDLRRVRTAREQVIAGVAGGSITLGEALELAASQREVESCYVSKLVEALPAVGKVRGRRLLADIGVPVRSRCGDLSPEQRRAILGAVQ